MKKLLLGTRNKTRKIFVSEILRELPIEIVGLDELGIKVKAVEDGINPMENSIKKAKIYHEQCGLPTLSIDAGLYIDKFPEDKQPGVFVRRINGSDEVSDMEMLEHYIRELNKVGGSSEGCWKVAITLALSKEHIYTTSYDRGTFFTAERCSELSEGEPLNSIQFYRKSGKYNAQMTVMEKKESQRGLAEHILKFIEENMEF